MQTKSAIQIIRENLKGKLIFTENLKNLMNDYLIEDSYFSRDNYNNVIETVKGYFDLKKEYTDLEEAVRYMENEDSIRIINNQRFQVGRVFEKISDTTGENVIDICGTEVFKHND